MIDKFQKLFGPNPPRATATQQATLAFEDSAEDIEHKKRIARIKNKRRLLGLFALALFVAVVAPSVLSPNDYYADRGAKLEIPGLESDTPAKVVPINQTKPEVKRQQIPSVAPEPKAPASLTSANKVAANAKPAHPTVDEGGLIGKETVADSKKQAPTKPRVIDKTQKYPLPNTANATASGKSGNASVKNNEATKDKKTSLAKETQSKKAESPAASQSGGVLRASANGRYFIQVIATSNKDAAQKRAQSLMKLGVPAYTEIVHRRGSDLWRVRVGRFMTQDEARRALDILALNSIENGGINQEKQPAKAKNN